MYLLYIKLGLWFLSVTHDAISPITWSKMLWFLGLFYAILGHQSIIDILILLI